MRRQLQVPEMMAEVLHEGILNFYWNFSYPISFIMLVVLPFFSFLAGCGFSFFFFGGEGGCMLSSRFLFLIFYCS